MGWILSAGDCECEHYDCGNPHPDCSCGTEYVASNHNVYQRVDRADLEFLGESKGVEAQAEEGRGGGGGMDAGGEGGESFSEEETQRFMNTKTLAGYGSIVMSLLTALAAAPYTLGEVATIIPPEWKAKVFVASAIATMILRIIRDNTSPTTPTPPTQ